MICWPVFRSGLKSHNDHFRNPQRWFAWVFLQWWCWMCVKPSLESCKHFWKPSQCSLQAGKVITMRNQSVWEDGQWTAWERTRNNKLALNTVIPKLYISFSSLWLRVLLDKWHWERPQRKENGRGIRVRQKMAHLVFTDYKYGALVCIPSLFHNDYPQRQ